MQLNPVDENDNILSQQRKVESRDWKQDCDWSERLEGFLPFTRAPNSRKTLCQSSATMMAWLDAQELLRSPPTEVRKMLDIAIALQFHHRLTCIILCPHIGYQDLLFKNE